MSLLSNIKNTAISLYNYLTEDDKEKSPAASKTTTKQKIAQKPVKATEVKPTITVPMVNPAAQSINTNDSNIKGYGDTLYTKNPTEKSGTYENKEKLTLKELKTALPAALAKNGINKAELKLKLSTISGIQTTKEDFQELEPKLQELMLNYVLESVERCEKAKSEGKLNNVSITDAVAMDIAMMYKFITSDENGKQVDLKTMTPEQVTAKRKAIDEKFHMQKKLREKEINKLPEEERVKAKKELENELAAHRKHMFQKLYKNMKPESALELLLIVAIKDSGEAAQELMEYYPSDIREEIANIMQSFKNFKAYINIAKGRGEDLGDEAAKIAFKKYHMIFGSYKTKDNLKSYMADAKAFIDSREGGEFPEAVYKGTAMGIGQAAYANHVMTSDEKNETISSWVNDYSGYLTDTEMALTEIEANEYIEKYLEQHPEERETFSRAKSMKEIFESTLGREFKPDEKVLESIKNKKENAKIENDNKSESNTTNATTENTLRPQAKTGQLSSGSNMPTSSAVTTPIKTEQAKLPEEVLTEKKSPKIVAQKLLNGQIDKEQAKKDVGGSEYDFVMMCADNPTLKALYKNDIIRYIRVEKNNDNLRAIIAKAPELALTILENMQGDKEEFAQELVGKHKVNSCISMLIQEDMKNENNKRYIV